MSDLCPVCGTAFAPDCPACIRPNARPVPQVRGVAHPHLLAWGDAYASYLTCTKCGTGWSPNATVLELLSECPAYVGAMT